MPTQNIDAQLITAPAAAGDVVEITLQYSTVNNTTGEPEQLNASTIAIEVFFDSTQFDITAANDLDPTLDGTQIGDEFFDVLFGEGPPATLQLGTDPNDPAVSTLTVEADTDDADGNAATDSVLNITYLGGATPDVPFLTPEFLVGAAGGEFDSAANALDFITLQLPTTVDFTESTVNINLVPSGPPFVESNGDQIVVALEDAPAPDPAPPVVDEDPLIITAIDTDGNGLIDGGLFFDFGAGFEANLTDDVLSLGTDAFFSNVFALFEVVEGTDGGIDTDGDGVADVLPADAGYAEAAIAAIIPGSEIQGGSSGDPLLNTTAADFNAQPILAGGGQNVAPILLANGGSLIGDGEGLADAFTDFVAQEAGEGGIFNNAAETTEDVVAYFSFQSANPDGAEHFQETSLGSGVFGVEDLPANLGESDNDFNDLFVSFAAVEI